MAAESGWNIFSEDGKTALNFTSLISLELNDGARVAAHPLERGSFASYNKVALPLSIEASLGLHSSPVLQQEAINTLSTLKHSAMILSFATPCAYYDSLTLENYRYKRSLESGASLLIISIKLIEVREPANTDAGIFSMRQCKNSSSVGLRDTGRATLSPFIEANLRGVDSGDYKYCPSAGSKF